MRAGAGRRGGDPGEGEHGRPFLSVALGGSLHAEDEGEVGEAVREVVVLEGLEGGEDVAQDGGVLAAVLLEADEGVVVDGVVVHLAVGQQIEAQVQELLQGRGVIAPDELLFGCLVALLDGLRELEVVRVRVVGWLLAD